MDADKQGQVTQPEADHAASVDRERFERKRVGSAVMRAYRDLVRAEIDETLVKQSACTRGSSDYNAAEDRLRYLREWVGYYNKQLNEA